MDNFFNIICDNRKVWDYLFFFYIKYIMDNTYWVLAFTIFLSFLSLIKYTNKQQLRSWIEDFVDRILPREVEEPEEIVELEEIQDMIYDFVIRNKEIFSRIKVNNEQSRSSETSEGDSKES